MVEKSFSNRKIASWILTSVFIGTVAQLLALLVLLPHSKKVMGLIPAWGAVGTGGRFSFSAQVGYLPGLSVWSLHVHKGFPPPRTPTEKHAKRTEHSCPSLTETDGSLGPRALR